MTFDDNSTVTVKNASGGSYGCFLVQSVRLSDGTLYSIVKVQDNGTIDVEVTSGSKFEVVTPSAIVGVRGTRFTVATSNNGPEVGYKTVVTHTDGIVVVTDSETGNVSTLKNIGETANHRRCVISFTLSYACEWRKTHARPSIPKPGSPWQAFSGN